MTVRAPGLTFGLFTSQCLLKLPPLLLPLCEPPLDFLFQFCVWPDLVHGEGTPVKGICLVTGTERERESGLFPSVPRLGARTPVRRRC